MSYDNHPDGEWSECSRKDQDEKFREMLYKCMRDEGGSSTGGGESDDTTEDPIQGFFFIWQLPLISHQKVNLCIISCIFSTLKHSPSDNLVSCGNHKARNCAGCPQVIDQYSFQSRSL